MMLEGCRQLIVVIASSWVAWQGELTLWEKTDRLTWCPVSDPVPVTLGHNGMAWGRGLHPLPDHVERKREGDGKSPAGAFAIGSAFGQQRDWHGQWQYLFLEEGWEAIDDPLSSYYNQILQEKKIAMKDWVSAEKMWLIPEYALGAVINHNSPHPEPYAGSAIFLHVWRSSSTGTAGCTAMSYDHMQHILLWIDEEKRAALVQLPIEMYKQVQQEWGLPPLVTSINHTISTPTFTDTVSENRPHTYLWRRFLSLSIHLS